MGTASVLYRIVLVLHILASIVGFGGLIAGAVLNARAFRSPASQARTLLRATLALSKPSYNALYGLVLLGIVLVAISDKAFSFGDPWISAAFMLWFAIIGISHGLVRPSVTGLVARSEALAAATLGQSQAVPALETDDEANSIARKLAMGEGAVQVLLVLSLAVMIWKPGL